MWKILGEKINLPESKVESFLSIKEKDFISGKFIILGDISKDIKSYKKIVNGIIDEAETEYFSTEGKDLEKRFEHCLQKINIKINELVKKYGEEWIYKFNCLIAVVKDDEVYFSSTGKVKAFLIQDSDIIEVLEEDLLKEPNPVKLFENLVSGKIQKKESMFLCNEKILDYLSIERIRILVIENKVLEAIKEFKALLNKPQIKSSFVFSIIKYEKEEEEEKKSPLKEKKVQKDSEKKLYTQDEVRSKTIEKAPIASLKEPDYKVKPKRSRSRSFKNLFYKIPKINFSSKLFLIIILIISFLFLKNIYSNKKEKIERKAVEEYNVLISDIQLKHNDAEVAVIYKQNQKAIKILDEALALIEKLPDKTETQQSNKKILLKENNRIRNLALNIKEIENPILLLDILNLGDGKYLTYYYPKTREIFLLNLDKGSFHKMDIETQKISLFSIEGAKKFSQVKLIAGVIQNEIIFITKDNNVLILNLGSNKIRAGKIEGLTEDIVLASTYQNKLYILCSSGQIYKYYPSLEGFSKKTKWLLEDINFGSPKKMMIDGNIWILNKEGKVFKLYRGKLVKFNLKIENKKFKDFYTDINSEKIYLIDSSRIYSVDKNTGNLLSTYSSSKFESLSNIFAISGKKIILLDGTKIYGIAEI